MRISGKVKSKMVWITLEAKIPLYLSAIKWSMVLTRDKFTPDHFSSQTGIDHCFQGWTTDGNNGLIFRCNAVWVAFPTHRLPEPTQRGQVSCSEIQGLWPFKEPTHLSPCSYSMARLTVKGRRGTLPPTVTILSLSLSVFIITPVRNSCTWIWAR